MAALSKSIALVPAEPTVEVEVSLAVVVGTQELTLDDAVNRLAELQEQERIVKKEKDPLRKSTERALRDAGIKKHATPEGHSATCYTQEREKVDKEYLRSVLTPEQYERAFGTKEVDGMRIR